MQQQGLLQPNNDEQDNDDDGDSEFEDCSDEDEDENEESENKVSDQNKNENENEKKQIEEEESKEDSLGCKHYLRKCKIQSPCCKKWYGCRLCHDEQYTGFKDQCLVERMDRTKISTIECLVCHEVQPASNKCVKCEREFARYYCDKCHLWQNKQVEIYHCDKCQMCRVGVESNNFHCDRCDMCWPKVSINSHKCVQNSENQDCPICYDNIKHSTQFVITLSKCGHAIHQNCLDQYFKKSKTNKCPLCNTAINDMSQQQIESLDKSIQEMTKNLKDFPKEFLDENGELKKVQIVCNQCNKKSSTPINPLFILKCQNEECGSYQTDQI